MEFEMMYDEPIISMNQYLAPTADIRGGRAYPRLYVTKKAKDWKKRFVAHARREIMKQKWDVEPTKDGIWCVEFEFWRARVNQDTHNGFKLGLDAMVEAGLIADDKNVIVRTVDVHDNDKKNARFRFKIYKHK